MKNLFLFLIAIFVSSTSIGASKATLVQKFDELKVGLEKRLLELDNLIGRKIDEIDSPSDDTLKVERILLKRIQEARETREELRLRLEIVEALRERAVLHYNEQDLKVFLQDQISTLVRNELGLGSRSRDDSEIVTALLHLKAAMKITKLSGVDLLVWIDGYLETSGIRSPLDLQPFHANADYSNRVSSESGAGNGSSVRSDPVKMHPVNPQAPVQRSSQEFDH